jgi:hypothetical protein
MPPKFAALALTTALWAGPASAVSEAVTSACRDDYFAYCSAHAVGSEGLRQCMRTNGASLSLGCVYALIKAGEVTLTEVKAIEHRLKNAASR